MIWGVGFVSLVKCCNIVSLVNLGRSRLVEICKRIPSSSPWANLPSAKFVVLNANSRKNVKIAVHFGVPYLLTSFSLYIIFLRPEACGGF